MFDGFSTSNEVALTEKICKNFSISMQHLNENLKLPREEEVRAAQNSPPNSNFKNVYDI